MIDTTQHELAFVGSLFEMALDKPVTEIFKYVSRVDPDDLTDQVCSTAYRFIKRAVMNEQHFDVVSIAGEIESAKIPGLHIGFSDIGAIHRNHSGYAAIESHINQIKQASLRRGAINTVTAMLGYLQTSENVLQAIGAAESAISKLIEKANGGASDLTHITELLNDWIIRAEDEADGKSQEVGFTTGFESSDRMLGDCKMKPGSLLVIGANPGKGKSALMVTMSVAIAEQYKNMEVHVYSLEMPAPQITDRVMGLPVQNKKPKYYADHDWGLISDHLERLKQTKLYICDNPVLTVEQIKMNARNTISKGGRVSAIFVDYLTLMKLPKADRHDLSVGEVTKQCKRLAKELGCVVVLLAQLSRTNMNRANKRPINSDLRDSGQIENDADYILFPFYEPLFDSESQAGPYAELIWSKNRHGPYETQFAKVVNGVWKDCDQQEAKARFGLDNRE